MTTKEKVSAAISRELQAGAMAEDIEEFFKQNGIEYSWDPVAERYQALAPVSTYHDVTIQVYVDADRRFLRAEVHDSYTAP
jgi:hypothetical protein